MAKTDLSYCAFGARTLLRNLGKFTEEAGNVRDHASEDTEYVHRMRVATRRLRSAMPLFAACFPSGYVQGWEKGIKGVTKVLGKARDVDVQIMVLEDTMNVLPDPDPEAGIRRLMLRLRQRREAMQPGIVKALDKFFAGGAENIMMERFREILGKARVEKAPLLSETIFTTAAEIGMDRMADTLSYDDFIRNPGNVEQLHALRKSAKKLRYTLEVFDSPYRKRLQPFIAGMKKLQTLLGDIHDCDVWCMCLPSFLEKEEARTVEYYGYRRSMSKIRRGVEYFAANRKAARSELYAEFIEYWNKMSETDFWEKLGESLEAGSNLLEGKTDGKDMEGEEENENSTDR